MASTSFLRIAAIGALSGLVLLACDDNPVAESRDDPAELVVNPDFAVVDAADQTTIDAFVRSETGQPTRDPVFFERCDDKITVALDTTRVTVEPPDRAVVVAGNMLGESCVDVTSGSLSKQVDVNVVPAVIELTMTDTLRSGESASAQVSFLDAAGNAASGFDLSQVVFSVEDTLIGVVDDAGAVTSRAPGLTTVSASLVSGWGAERIGDAAFTVVPSVFAGTATSSAGNSGDEVTYTEAVGEPSFDDDTEVTVGGLKTFVLALGSLTTAIPFGLQPGEQEVLFTNVGPNQLALTTSFDVAALASNDDLEPNDDAATATPVALPFEDLLAVDQDDLDDFFRLDLVQTTNIHLFMDWDDAVNGDMDLLVTDLTISDFQCGFVTATGNHPEEGDCELSPGSYLIWANNFAEAGLTNYHIEVTAN